MEKKLYILLLLSFALFFVLSCAKTKSLGAGVSINAQGDLKIDAPLYVIDKSLEKPMLRQAPDSMNYAVYAGFPFTGGADAAIGELILAVDNSDIYRPITLYPNRRAKILTSENFGIKDFYIEGGSHEYVYSNEDVSISGKVSPKAYNWTWIYEFNIRIKRGWNIILTEDNKGVYTRTTSRPSSKAV
jgi:hypothetical protein